MSDVIATWPTTTTTTTSTTSPGAQPTGVIWRRAYSAVQDADESPTHEHRPSLTVLPGGARALAGPRPLAVPAVRRRTSVLYRRSLRHAGGHPRPGHPHP